MMGHKKKCALFLTASQSKGAVQGRNIHIYQDHLLGRKAVDIL